MMNSDNRYRGFAEHIAGKGAARRLKRLKHPYAAFAQMPEFVGRLAQTRGFRAPRPRGWRLAGMRTGAQVGYACTHLDPGYAVTRRYPE